MLYIHCGKFHHFSYTQSKVSGNNLSKYAHLNMLIRSYGQFLFFFFFFFYGQSLLKPYSRVPNRLFFFNKLGVENMFYIFYSIVSIEQII